MIETEFLVVGCGPAGASLACFLASHGLKGVMIGKAPGTANTPRAHITNMAAFECLRDIGLEEELTKVSSSGGCMVHTRWCHSMAGAEYARVYSWGNDPKRKGDYELASPCSTSDLPQTLLEPVLIRQATNQGFKVRFDTSLLSFNQDAATGTITAQVCDHLSNEEYEIRTKYLFGADGAQSRVVKELGLPLIGKAPQGMAINILVKADLSHLIDSRMGNLHYVMQPDREHPDFAFTAIVRMVKPWHEWMFILFPTKDFDVNSRPSEEAYMQRVRDFIGDDTPAEILNISKWFINEIVAEKYSVNNIHCLGDAVHRHPPMNGLGSNTCIQDAFNLAWKVAYVHKGWADPSLLETYSTERQPVGHSIITRANQAFRDHFGIWEALGLLPIEVSKRQEMLAELEALTIEGQQRRRNFQEAILNTGHEYHGLGIEMGQRYSGPGIYSADEPRALEVPEREAGDPVFFYHINTYPGSRLPHVWLNKTVPTAPTSTIDIAGHGRFVLFTGHGGGAWKVAVELLTVELGLPLQAHAVGFRLEWEDFYFDWARVRGVEESGAVLVRPDRFVAWRANEVLPSEEACTNKLRDVMKSVLGLKR